MSNVDELPDTPCLSDELLAALLDARLPPDEVEQAHHHTARCQKCHELFIAAVRGGPFQEDGGEQLLSALANPAVEFPLKPTANVVWTPPDEFEEFRIERHLGRGAMGVVYLAYDNKLERRVAVKFIAAQEPNSNARKRFLAEARAIARLQQHPNVVTVFRVGEIEAHPYIVSEYLAGQSLAELRKPLPWRRVLGLGLGLARGLAEAHRAGVLHRDIKPSNVLLTEDGRVKLLDFGLAEFVGPDAPVKLKGARSVAGTPFYMAPELFQKEPASPRSDIYSLGQVLLELCVGRLPTYPPELAPPTGARSAPQPVTPSEPERGLALTARVPGIDPDLAALIERCIRDVPDERFASADELCRALERLWRPLEQGVHGEGNPYRGLAPFEAEHRALFFGREADVAAVLALLRSQGLVLVAGDSGVGKSSLCRAGILPYVEQGALDEWRDFSVRTLEPGRRPLATLAAVLAPIIGQPEARLATQLAERPEDVGPVLRAAHKEGLGLLLFVDQLEELITLSSPEEAACFARCLAALALPAAGVRVLLAVRGDFFTRVSQLPDLGDRMTRAFYLLRPLDPKGVHAAIVAPVRTRNVSFEAELLETLSGFMTQGEGSLPLLQFALAELWERRDQAKEYITSKELSQMGGVAGALSRHADAVLGRLDRERKRAARRMLGALITAEKTRSQRSEEELTAGSAEARATLRILVEGRLLHARAAGDETNYEIAHEVLISNWSTLRTWLDEDAGQRAIQQRIKAACAEWERLDCSGEPLWKKRQLNEVRELDITVLGKREQAFLFASRLAVRRQMLLRALGILAIGLMAAISYFVPRLQRQFRADDYLDDARRRIEKGRGLAERARAGREQAIDLFNGKIVDSAGASLDPRNPREIAEDRWDQVLNEYAQADAEYASATRTLEDALALVHDHDSARLHLTQLLYERIELAELFHRKDEQVHFRERFDRVAPEDSVWRTRLAAPAKLEIKTEPPGARVELTHYKEEKEILKRQLVSGYSLPLTTPVAPIYLPPGSYQLKFTMDGHAPVELPLVLRRGDAEKVNLVLPSVKQVPNGYVYIPPGRFLTGSADAEEVRERQESPPMHERVFEEGYIIGKQEVTLKDWIEYLDSKPGAQARHLLEKPISSGEHALSLRQEADNTWRFTFQFLASETHLTARVGEPIHFPRQGHLKDQDWLRFPLTGVSADDAKGYLDWLDHTEQLRGARLCSELEWTRAASGADGRKYPHGNKLRKEEANIDATYGFRPDAYGPDEVGSYEASVSPFGLYDMAGNAFEMTVPAKPSLGEIVQRGGSWYYSRLDAMIPTRQSGVRDHRDPRVGLRVCAPLPAR